MTGPLLALSHHECQKRMTSGRFSAIIGEVIPVGGMEALPTYEYRCLSCDHQFERFQRMSDEPVKECEICGEPVKRLLFPVAVHFKGNGFYSTDYAKKNAMGASGGKENGGNSEPSSSAKEDNPAEASKAPVTKTSEPAAAAAKKD